VPLVKIIQGDEVFEQNVKENTNLVVQAGIKNYPFPQLVF
jgi:hypothetical protein